MERVFTGTNESYLARRGKKFPQCIGKKYLLSEFGSYKNIFIREKIFNDIKQIPENLF